MLAPSLLAAISTALAASGDTSLTPAEKAGGWKLCSGAGAASLWHGYKQSAFPKKGWVIEGGEIRQVPGGDGADIITNETFADVELTCDFKLDPKANSGIIWRATEQLDASWQTGPEFQLLEDGTYTDKLKPGQYCGALYDLYPPAEAKKMNPAGQWNHARLRLRNGVIQHWINGVKVVEASIFDPAGRPTKEWLDKIAASKFKDYKGFGVQPTGAIALQDHGGGVAFRDIKIRDLAAPIPGEVSLFNGKDLDGWEPIVPELAGKTPGPASVWSVKDGVLICAGNPVGYIRTKKDYTNYVLRLQWRFDPAKGAGNSGVLLRMVGQDKVWPKSVEAQLHSTNAGDFWNIDEYKMTVAKERTSGRNTKKTHMAERPIGEWNEYEIVVNKGDIILYVNGEELNRATGVEENAGKICLQSEGAEIQFRNIRLVPLD